MSSPRSRNRTQGAFGNRQPRPIERDFSLPAPTPEAAPRQPTIADHLIEYARPIIDQAGNHHTAIKGALNVAILIWNASIEGEEKIAEAKKTLTALPGATAEQVEDLMKAMLERKQEMFPGEKLLITNFVLKFSHRLGTQFRVTAVNVNPEGVQKADLSDLVKVGG
jgi:hypothetical protein